MAVTDQNPSSRVAGVMRSSDSGGWRLSLRYAFREMRGGLTGFAVFIACIALGVGAIAAVGSVTRALVAEITEEGQAILGGDVAFRINHRRANADEITYFGSLGDVSEVSSLRAMARTEDRKDQTLVSFKGVDAAYPLFGALELESGRALHDVIGGSAAPDGALPAVVEPVFAGRLGLETGDRFRIGDALLVLADLITREPDRLSGGLSFGPRVMVSQGSLQATGLAKPGSLVRWRYRVAVPGLDDAALQQLAVATQERFSESGWAARTRARAAPAITSQIEEFRDFLTLVGLTALAVGGVGVANSVRAYLEKRRPSIATFKAVGGSGPFIMRLYLAQIMLVAGVGIGIGLALGAVAPILIGSFLEGVFPVAGVAGGIYPSALLLALVYGVLTALTFALVPLGRARQVPVSALYRDHVSKSDIAAPKGAYALATVAALALAGTAIGFSENAPLAAGLIVGGVLGFIVLRLVASGIMVIARRLPRPRLLEARIALANIHRPNALTPTIVLSLGLGLSLLVTLALIETSLTRQLTQSLPERAPSFFFLDVPSTRAAAFKEFVAVNADDATIEQVPMLRGRIVTLKDIPSADYPTTPESDWVLRGDRGITYSSQKPEGSRLITGAWWDADYSGPPLVSFEDELANELNLKVGDTLVVNVLGRNITLEIANTRTVDWGDLGINFVMVFSPNAVAGAPHMMLTTLAYPDGGTLEQETAMTRAVLDDFPEVTVVRVKEALEAVTSLVGRMATAIRLAAGVALVAAVLVLAGALAASHQFRIYDAVVLKTLGATRGRLLRAFTLEFVALGLITAVFGIAVGALSSYVVTTMVMNIDFVFSLPVALMAALGAVTVTVVLGLVGTWRALGVPPAGLLRSL
jgi:putative ABC transport system permease protein